MNQVDSVDFISQQASYTRIRRTLYCGFLQAWKQFHHAFSVAIRIYWKLLSLKYKSLETVMELSIAIYFHQVTYDMYFSLVTFPPLSLSFPKTRYKEEEKTLNNLYTGKLRIYKRTIRSSNLLRISLLQWSISYQPAKSKRVP